MRTGTTRVSRVATVAELSFWTSAADVPWGKNKANQFEAQKSALFVC
jgi:hypothetical protein